MKDRAKLFYTLEIIVYIAIIGYLLDIIVLGGGDLTRIFGVSTKMIFFAVAVVLSASMILLDVKKYITNKLLLAVGLFIVVIGINAIRGFVSTDNISTAILLSDVKGFLNFLMVIPMVYVLNQKERVIRLIKAVTITLSVIAVIVIFLSFYLKFPQMIQGGIYEFLSENTICGIARLTRNTIRVFFHTASRLFFGGFLFALGLSIVEKNKTPWIVSMILQVIGIVLSFTRSIYLGLFVAAVALFVVVLRYYKEEFQIMCRHICIMCVAVIASLLLMSVVQGENVFSVAINRCLLAINTEIPGEDSTEDTEDDTEVQFPGNLEDEQANLSIREIRTETALKNISKNPILGSGLGTINDPNGELIEYFYLDLLSKIGIVGVLMFLLPAALATLCMWKNWKQYVREQKLFSILTWTLVLYLLVISYFNPCMNTTTGLSMYCLLLAVVMPWKSETK